MKTTVKYLSFVISVALLLTCFSFPGAVFAEQDGIFIYRAEGNTAVLTGIDSSASGEIVVPASLDGLTVVMVDGAFKNRSDITSVVLPDTVEVITAESFAYCNYLTSITLPANLVMIGESAFCACILLDNVVLPDSITTLGQYAFAWCEALTSINIPSALRNIKRGTFTGCVSLATIEVGENISTIEQDAFANTAFYRDESNWEDGVLYLEYYVIKARESISGRCILRENTKLIGELAFIKCGLTELVVYGDLRTVNSSAFSMCNYLTDIYYSGDEDGRCRIRVSSKNNYAFTNALWHYGYDPDVKE
ncbi:MAG: leucine-rich repeat domain-containing protein, partial [Clostridia bacterium]|nr:leucine-rich repeat domain-containing protein [Clostridia bacterium]